jgi:hypothetical protein
MKIPQIIRNVKIFNQKTVDLQNISGIGHPDEIEKKKHFIGQADPHRPTRTIELKRLKEKGERLKVSE